MRYVTIESNLCYVINFITPDTCRVWLPTLNWPRITQNLGPRASSHHLTSELILCIVPGSTESAPIVYPDKTMDDWDVHVLGSFFKEQLNSLPSPLFTYEGQDLLFKIGAFWCSRVHDKSRLCTNCAHRNSISSQLALA